MGFLCCPMIESAIRSDQIRLYLMCLAIIYHGHRVMSSAYRGHCTLHGWCLEAEQMVHFTSKYCMSSCGRGCWSCCWSGETFLCVWLLAKEMFLGGALTSPQEQPVEGTETACSRVPPFGYTRELTYKSSDTRLLTHTLACEGSRNLHTGTLPVHGGTQGEGISTALTVMESTLWVAVLSWCCFCFPITNLRLDSGSSL